MTDTTGWKPERGWLTGLKIPLNAAGDPAFKVLSTQDDLTSNKQNPDAVLAVFTPEQVVYLVNKQLYALAYQRETHKQRAQDERDLLAPLKAKFKELFGGSWAKATEEQVQACVDALKRDKEAK